VSPLNPSEVERIRDLEMEVTMLKTNFSNYSAGVEKLSSKVDKINEKLFAFLGLTVLTLLSAAGTLLIILYQQVSNK
jgi:hypothetical protein